MNHWIQDAIAEYFYQGTEKEFTEDEIILIIRNFQRMEAETGMKVSLTDHKRGASD